MSTPLILATLHYSIWLDMLGRVGLSKNSLELTDAVTRAELYIDQLLDGGQIQREHSNQLRATLNKAVSQRPGNELRQRIG